MLRTMLFGIHRVGYDPQGQILSAHMFAVLSPTEEDVRDRIITLIDGTEDGQVTIDDRVYRVTYPSGASATYTIITVFAPTEAPTEALV